MKGRAVVCTLLNTFVQPWGMRQTYSPGSHHWDMTLRHVRVILEWWMPRFMWVSAVPMDFMYKNRRAHLCRHLFGITCVAGLWTWLLHVFILWPRRTNSMAVWKQPTFVCMLYLRNVTLPLFEFHRIHDNFLRIVASWGGRGGWPVFHSRLSRKYLFATIFRSLPSKGGILWFVNFPIL
jgi:hypothetical protein